LQTRYLALAEPERAANAEAAALLALNLASDRLARRALVAAGAVEALVGLLQVGMVWSVCFRSGTFSLLCHAGVQCLRN
jgi:hypothetical protein